MYEQLTLGICPNANVTVSAFHAKVSQLLESGVDSKTLEALSFLKSCGWLKPDTLKFYSQKMSKGYSTMMGEEPLEQSSEQWMNWGTMSSGSYLTANIGYRRIGNGCSLLDILEENPPEKYFLSKKATQRLLSYKDTEVVETLKKSGGAIGGTQAHAAVMNDTSPALATFNGAQTLYAEPIVPSLNAGDRRTRGIFPTDRGGGESQRVSQTGLNAGLSDDFKPKQTDIAKALTGRQMKGTTNQGMTYVQVKTD